METDINTNYCRFPISTSHGNDDFVLFLCQNSLYKDAYFLTMSRCFKDINEIPLN